MKRCTICKRDLDESAFAWKRQEDGIRHRNCRECQAVMKKRHYEANKATYMARNKVYAKAMKAEIDGLKSRPCVDCGVRYPPYIMDFDHLPDAVKVLDVARMRLTNARRKVLEEIAKCEVVCANCHRERTHRRRIDQAGFAKR
jgi:hypothetical protein